MKNRDVSRVAAKRGNGDASDERRFGRKLKVRCVLRLRSTVNFVDTAVCTGDSSSASLRPRRYLTDRVGIVTVGLMLKWFRTRLSGVARLLVLSLAALALPHADSNHDADSAFALLAVHDASGHGVGTPASEDAEPGHCAICHLSRPFRPLPQTAIPAITSAATTGFFPVDDSTTAKTDAAAQPPLRAPPLSPDHA